MTGYDRAWLGIDLGTQSVRALVVAADGQVLGAGASTLTSHRDGPRHEQDPATWWPAAASACRAALAASGPTRVDGVSVDGTSGTVLLVDRSDGRPLTPALMYDDTRAGEQAHRVNEAGADLWAALGYRRMQPAWALPKLAWLLAEHPELTATARLAHQVDVVNRALVGGPVATDLSNALKTGVDLIGERWPTEVFDALGLPGALLPDLVRPGTPIGTVGAAAAELTGLPKGTPVIAGCTDGCAAQLGAGALAVGSWNSVLGTTLVLKGVTEELINDPLGVVYSHKSPDGRWLPGGASGTGAGAVGREFAGRDLDELAAGAARYEPAAVLAYPLASARGERFPFLAPDAEAFLLGTPRDDYERYAAMLQGVGYLERLCFDYLASLGAPAHGDLMLTGGGARGRYWCQLRADILGRPVKLPANAESALGVAVLAATPGRSPAEVAAEMVRIRETVDPRPEVTARLEEPYRRLLAELTARGWLPAEQAVRVTSPLERERR
ncbi:FGGY-family carbohydrate kinase [Pseudonocardia eucalypti]|uniref:FGGY-family carbohydrate kinase n=1 Tax=Pseudonocardia eucalypti TaxID=648755 RepID=A0ABP9R5U2_9PSEU|nr:sugar (pentulose or hexulose) kinase [Pseudonocardia eucalypti]